jgi:ATP-binding cassette, subfamily B, bacterial
MTKILLFLWKYIKLEKKELVFVVFPMLWAFIVSPLVPLSYKQFIDLISTNTINATIVHELWKTAWIFFGMIIFTQICWKTLEYWLIPLESAIAKRMYHDAFHHILGQSHQFFSGQPGGSIVRIISRLADTAWQFLDTIIFQVLRVSFHAIIMIIVLWSQHVILGVSITIWMILLILVKWKLWRNNFELNTSVSEASTKISGQISDVFTNAFTVLTFWTQAREMRAFRNIVSDWTVLQRKMWWQEYRIFFTTTAFILVLQIASIVGLIYLWSHGTITAGTCTLVLVYMTLFLDQAVEINFVFRSIYRQSSDMVEAINLLEVYSDVRDEKNAPPIVVKKWEIEFRNVNFTYHEKGESVLKDFSLHIKPGERIALVGVSGSGKTTVLKLLFRLYDIQKGAIIIDGQNIAHVQQETLRSSLSMVPQDPALFHRSVGENIAYAREDATKEDIRNAAQHAFAHDFIELLPQKYDTLVGERGVKLSGWERQRVALARSILADKPVLVLDEATSALDSVSEKYIQESLHEIIQWRTTIVIAHRLSTIMQMDRIIVMEKGKIVEEGTHQELIQKQSGHYKKLWDIQTGEFIRDVL